MSFIIFGVIGLLVSISAKANYQEFQIKVKPGSEVVSINVVATGNLEKYDAADVNFNQWTMEVRGQLTLNEFLSGFRIRQAQIRYGVVGQTLQNYEIKVSGGKRSLTGNNGHQWAEHSIALSGFGDMQPYIDACNNAVENDIANGFSLTQALNKKRSISISQEDSSFRAGLRINVSDSPNYLTEEDSVALPLRVFCKPTGYVKMLPTASSNISIVEGIAESHLTILEQVSQFSGTCKIILSGFVTTNLPNVAVQFQYEHTNGKKSDVKSVTTDHAKTAMFSHTYTIDNNPYDDEAGSIRLIGVSHNFQSDWKTYTMRCEDPATNSFQTEIPPQLSVNVVVRETHLVKGQICPKDVLIQGSIIAGASIEGHTVFIGSGSSSYQSETMPYDLNIGEKKNFFRVRSVEIPSTLGNLQVINDSEPVLQHITITQGMSMMDENNEMIATTGQISYTFHCSWPQVNPNFPGSNTLGTISNHIGSDTPTSLKGKSPFINRENENNKPINVGLRSDGELVQGRKPLQLLNHELSHTIQQRGKILIDADSREISQQAVRQKQQKNVPVDPAPLPYSVIGSKNLNKDGTKKWELKDGHDRLANQQPNHQIPLENATISSIQSVQRNQSSQMKQVRNTKTTLLKGKVGDRCKQNRFPGNVVINQSGQQRVVECLNGKILINRTKKVKRLWKAGDPVLFSPSNKKEPKNEIRREGLGDEMPEDFPAG